MCSIGSHECYCKVNYECTDPNWLCPTINGDEESNLCPECLDREIKEMEKYYDLDGESDV